MLVWNLMLMFAWTALQGSFTLPNLALGFVLGYAVLALLVRGGVVGSRGYVERVRRIAAFFFYFIYEMIIANLRVAYDVLTPSHKMRPGVIAIPLDAKTDAEITMLANVITLTPGTLSLDVSSDKRVLYIHVMYIDGDDPGSVRRSIKRGFERRILEVLR